MEKEIDVDEEEIEKHWEVSYESEKAGYIKTYTNIEDRGVAESMFTGFCALFKHVELVEVVTSRNVIKRLKKGLK